MCFSYLALVGLLREENFKKKGKAEATAAVIIDLAESQEMEGLGL